MKRIPTKNSDTSNDRAEKTTFDPYQKQDAIAQYSQ